MQPPQSWKLIHQTLLSFQRHYLKETTHKTHRAGSRASKAWCFQVPRTKSVVHPDNHDGLWRLSSMEKTCLTGPFRASRGLKETIFITLHPSQSFFPKHLSNKQLNITLYSHENSHFHLNS